MIPCDKCGYDNPLGRIFCAQCGDKLNLDQLNEPEMLRPEKKKTSRGLLFILLDIFVLALVLAALAFWPAGHKAALGSESLARAALGKLARLDSTAVSLALEFSEKEANVLAAGYLAGQKRSGVRHVMDIKSVEIVLDPNAVRATAFASIGPWSFGSYSLGPFPITYSVLAVPIKEDKAVRFDVRRGAIGHLPLPGPLGKPAAKKFEQIFSKAGRYKNLLNKADAIELQKGAVTIKIKK